MIRALSWTAAVLVSFLATTLAIAHDGDAAARREWVRQLSSPDAGIRQAAAHGLALLGREASGEVAALLPLLNDSDPSVRLEAVSALIAIRAKGDEVAAAAWRSQAADADLAVRRRARRLAKSLGAESRGAALELRKGLASEHANARKTAARGLGRGETKASGDVNSLLALVLDDEDEGVRSVAVAALADLGSPLREHQGALRDRLDATDIEMRRRSAKLLGQALPFEPATLRKLAAVLLATEDSRLRRLLLHRLTDHDRPSAELAQDFLREIAAARGGRREAAVQGLGAVGSGSAEEVETLIALRIERDGPRGAALKAMTQLARERGAIPQVAAFLSSPYEARRVAAAEVLEGVGEGARSESATLTELAANDPEAEVRSAALRALASVAETDHAKAMLEAASKDRSSDVRSTARVQLEALRRAEERRARRGR